jgi:hypothetical protein
MKIVPIALVCAFVLGGPSQAFAYDYNSIEPYGGNPVDSNPGTLWDIRQHYFWRYPVAAQFGPSTSGGHDDIRYGRSMPGGLIHHGESGPVYSWPVSIIGTSSKRPQFNLADFMWIQQFMQFPPLNPTDFLLFQQSQAALIGPQWSADKKVDLRITPPQHKHARTKKQSSPQHASHPRTLSRHE